MKVAVVLCSFNRKPMTLRIIGKLYAQAAALHSSLSIYLFDDGSTDGTLDEVRRSYPQVRLLQGNGNAYWCKSMFAAWNAAVSEHQFTHYLLLNDDVDLVDDALARISIWARSRPDSVLVGATKSLTTGGMSYSGVVQGKGVLTRSRFYKVDPHPVEMLDVDTLNANFVLVPQVVVDRVGILRPDYEHGMGDYDYGLRCRAAGISVLLCPGYFGICENNSVQATHQDGSQPVRTRWKKMMSPKGLPIRSWKLFCSSHMGLLWPIYFLWPYAKFWLSAARDYRFR